MVIDDGEKVPMRDSLSLIFLQPSLNLQSLESLQIVGLLPDAGFLSHLPHWRPCSSPDWVLGLTGDLTSHSSGAQRLPHLGQRLAAFESQQDVQWLTESSGGLENRL
ncbi:Tudor domain-containing protein 15 [Manis javanica]|nr:Tudor domain-containing protein 15 [Manis javanica]